METRATNEWWHMACHLYSWSGWKLDSTCSWHNIVGKWSPYSSQVRLTSHGSAVYWQSHGSDVWRQGTVQSAVPLLWDRSCSMYSLHGPEGCLLAAWSCCQRQKPSLLGDQLLSAWSQPSARLAVMWKRVCFFSIEKCGFKNIMQYVKNGFQIQCGSLDIFCQ